VGTVKGLRIFQWGKETVRGTAVAATSKIALENMDLEPIDSVVRPQFLTGKLHRNPGGNETPIKRGTTWKINNSPVVYDQLQHLLAMSVKGGVAASGAPSVYTWDFSRSLTADPAPESFTIERRTTDGSTPRDYEWAYCLISSISFHYKLDEPLRFSCDGFARRVQASTLTAALTYPSTEVPSSHAACSIDSTWANLGVTPIVGQVLSADVTFKTGIIPFDTLDGRTDLDFTTYVFNAAETGLDVKLRLLMAAQFPTEKTAAEAQTLRTVRLAVTGSASRALTLDMALKHEPGSLFKVDEVDGQDVVDMKLVDSDDGTNMFKAGLVNAINTYV
jgi:hypothetical protein